MSVNWSDAELVRLCLEGTSHDLTDEVVTAIGSRMAESRLVRDAVQESPFSGQIESRLRDLGLHSPAETQRRPSQSMKPAVAILAVVIVGWLLFSSRNDEPQPDETDPSSAVESRNEQESDESESVADEQNVELPPDAPNSAESSENEQEPSAEEPESDSTDKPQPANETAVEPAGSQTPAPDKDAPSETTKPNETVASDEVGGPWGNQLSRDVAPLRFEEVAWRLPGYDGVDEFTPAEFRQWFAPVSGRPFGILDEKHSNRRFTRLDGMARLKAPWVDSAVLRLTVYDTERCEFHVWSGNQGVRLKFFRKRQPNTWAAHRISRTNKTSPLTVGDYLTNDSGRWHRSLFGVMELRWERERLWLTRGDVALLNVPFPDRPTDIVLDGKLKIRDVEMLKSDPLPEESLPGEIERHPLLASATPADLEWQVSGEKTPPESMTRQGDAIELTVNAESTEPARFWTPAPMAGLCEFVFRIESADAGTGLYLGNPDGEPIITVARLWDPKARRAAVQLLSPTQKDTERTYDVDAWPPAWSGDGQWVRIVMGSGAVSLWTSPDRINWAWVADSPARGRFPGQRASIGVFAQPQAERRIRISHVEVNEFPELVSLADAELIRQVDTDWFEPLDILDSSSWLHRVIRHRPEDVDFDAWQRACAVATLRASPDNGLSLFLISGLLSESLSSQSDIELSRAFALLHEASLFCELWDSTRGRDLSFLYHEVARQAVQRSRSDNAAPVSTRVIRELMRIEFWSGHTPRLTPLDAVKIELTAMIEAGEFDAALKLIDEIIFWNSHGHPGRPWWQTVDEIYSLVSWAELAVQATLDSEMRATRQELPGRWKTSLTIDRHPLAHSVSKEAYNVMAEFQAAVSGNAYDDACAVISSAASSELLGLLPDSQDARLMISFPSAVALAMNQQPQLRRTMNEQFGAIGRLRVREAIQNADHRRIEAATVQFFGTLAAAESAAWLGDRALAAGQFAAARSYFERALDDYQLNSQIETSEQRAVRAKLELADQLSQSSDADPQSASTLSGDAPLEFNSTSVATAAFNALITELGEQAKTDNSKQSLADISLAPAGRLVAARIPDVAGYRTLGRGRHDGDQGERPGSSAPSDVDWVARQLAVEVSGDSAFLCNRFQLSRFDLTTGQTRWKQQLGGDHGNAHHWPMVPMRPLVTDDAVYCRRLRKDGTELICCDRESGNVRWTLRPGQGIVSDPFLIRGRLQVFLAGNAYAGPSVLELATIHAETGTVVSNVPVLNLFDVWQNAVPVCQIALDDGLIYFTVSGVAGCCNSEGQLLWIRRREWLPVKLDRNRRVRHWSPPVIDGESIVIFEPESPVIERADAATGRRQWSLTAPDFRRCLSAINGRLLLETDFGIRAVDMQTGENLWEYVAADLLDAVQVADDGAQLIVSRALPFAEGRTRAITPALIWLDAATGQETARLPLVELRHEEPRLGPLLAGPEKTWLMFARGRKEANRDVLELVRDDGQLPEYTAGTSVWSDWHKEARLETALANRLIRPDFERSRQSNEFSNAFAQLASGWLYLMPPQQKECGLVADFRGQKNVLRLRPRIGYSPKTKDQLPSELTVGAVRLFRPLTLADDANASLKFKVGHNQGESWLLTVEVNGERLLNTVINDETAPSGWQQVDVRLGHLAGQAATLVVTCAQADPKKPAWVFLHELPDPVTLTGQVEVAEQ